MLVSAIFKESSSKTLKLSVTAIGLEVTVIVTFAVSDKLPSDVIYENTSSPT